MSLGRSDEQVPGAGARDPQVTADAAVQPELAAGPANRGYIDRQHVLLDDMLRVTLEQRRCLIKGDVKGLDTTNRRLGKLLERQADLHREHPSLEEMPRPEVFEELRRLTQQLREESRTNYLLACRGAQFADLSLSLLQSAASEGDPPADSTASTSIRLVDARM